MGGHMRFVHTVEVDNDENRRLSYEGALSQLNELLNSGMQDGTFLEQDVPEEERIITGMTFIPEGTDNSESWGTAGTAPVNPGQGIENTPPVDVVPIGPFPDSSTKGRSASVSYGLYGLYGLFFLVAIALVVGIGVIMRRRQNKDDDDEDEDAGIGSVSSSSSVDEGEEGGDSLAFDLEEVRNLDSEEIAASPRE